MKGESHDEFMIALRPHYDALARFSRLITRNADDARDLAAETVLTALEAFSSLQEHHAFRTWLFRIAHRLATRHYRRQSRFERFPETEGPDDIPASSILPDEITDLAIVREHLEKLPDTYREILVLVDVVGFPLDEAATVLSLTVGGVKARLFRARSELARRLGVDRTAHERR